MKTSFNNIYLPVKNRITGEIYKEEHSDKEGLIRSIRVFHEPDNPVGSSWFISAIFTYKTITRRYYFGRTQKEVKELVSYINDFNYDPLLVI
jgi:hypothetical protein